MGEAQKVWILSGTTVSNDLIFSAWGAYLLLVPQGPVLISFFEKRANVQSETLITDHSIEEIMHSHGHKSWETRSKITVIVMWHS